MSATTIFLIVIALLGYIGAFVFWMKRGETRAAPAQQAPESRLPSFNEIHELLDSDSPMMPRTLLRSPAERSAWLWLRHDVFPKHNVLPKLPFTRFTLLRDQALGKKWFPVLSSTYCTFTICSDAGLAIGCVDLLPMGDENRGSVTFKRRLLDQCGMHYHIITIGQLPDAHELAAEFLGEAATTKPPSQEQQAARIEAMREQLHERLEENRMRRTAGTNSGFAPISAPGPLGGEPTGWGTDSFLAEPDIDEDEGEPL
ncbi:MAG: hypothetical protein IJR28_04665 [Ottowia sp.]|nr:hypothetical protein [Ottowia sp.]